MWILTLIDMCYLYIILLVFMMILRISPILCEYCTFLYVLKMSINDFFGFIIINFHKGPDAWHVELLEERVTYVGGLTISLRRTYDGNPITMISLSIYVELHMPFADIWSATTRQVPIESPPLFSTNLEVAPCSQDISSRTLTS